MRFDTGFQPFEYFIDATVKLLSVAHRIKVNHHKSGQVYFEQNHSSKTNHFPCPSAEKTRVEALKQL